MHLIESRWIWIISLAVHSVFVNVTFGQDILPAQQQASFLLKALSFDQNLANRCSDRVHIAVLYKGDKQAVAEVVEAFNQTGQKGVHGIPVTSSALPFESVTALMKDVDKEGINVLYIHSSVAKASTSILQVSRGKKIPSFGSTRKLVENGASLGLYLLDGAPKLMVNLRASRIEGLALAAEFLGISTVLK